MGAALTEIEIALKESLGREKGIEEESEVSDCYTEVTGVAADDGLEVRV